MAFIGYHASHEQLAPSALLEAVVGAEQAGFDGAFSADHLAPWTPRQGESGNALVWLGAALARTGDDFSIGVIATPGYRYHPVVTAHALATLGEMFPGRSFAALGSGELLNEHVIAEAWPSKDERTARLGESVDVIRRLLAGDEVTHDGRVHVHRARLWSLPDTPPPLLATATSPETASWAAGWADGILTVGAQRADVAGVLDAYRGGGGAGPAAVQIHFALGDTAESATRLVRDQWLHGVVTPPETWDVAQPEEFVRLAGDPTDDELREHVVVATSVGELADRIADIVSAGFDRVYLHEISQQQGEFVRDLAPELLTALRDRLEEDA